MRKSRPRYPKPKEIAQVLRILQVIPQDSPPKLSWRTSLQGTPNLRVESLTNEEQWVVDIYSGEYYCARVNGHTTEICKNLRSLVGYLCHTLGVKPQAGV